MSGEDSNVDLETQIRLARERAENFASSLNKAREQDNKFEEERQKWMQSFEEKSILVEQLERELAATVDALNREKEEKLEFQRQIDQPKPLLTVAPSSNPFPSQDHWANEGPRRVPVQLPMSSTNGSSTVIDHDDQSANRRVLELLKQSQDETAQVRRELSSVRSERDRLIDQLSVMKRQIERLTQDREELLVSIKNTDSKLKFRAEQVTNYEVDKDRFGKRESELNELVAELDRKLKHQNSELLVATTDLRAAKTYSESLEQRIAELNNKLLSTVGSASSMDLQKKIDDLERVAVELTVRAEKAESALRVFMDARDKSERSQGVRSDALGVGSPPGWKDAHKLVEEGIQKSKNSQV